MKRPSPRAVRLVCALVNADGVRTRPPPPPFGLAAFEESEGADLAVLLELDPEETPRAQIDRAAAQIPLANELPDGRLVVVLAARAHAGGFFARLLGPLLGGGVRIPVEVRATALLARGYANLGSDGDLVWGDATPRPS